MAPIRSYRPAQHQPFSASCSFTQPSHPEIEGKYPSPDFGANHRRLPIDSPGDLSGFPVHPENRAERIEKKTGGRWLESGGFRIKIGYQPRLIFLFRKRIGP